MKLILNLYFTLVISISFSQSIPGDQPQTNPYVPGDLIVQVFDDAKIRDLVFRAPENYKLTINKELSPTAHIWQLSFDPNAVSHETMINWFYGQHETQLAQNNYYLKLRSTLPNDASFTSQWHHNNTGQTGGTTDADIDSDLA